MELLNPSQTEFRKIDMNQLNNKIRKIYLVKKILLKFKLTFSKNYNYSKAQLSNVCGPGANTMNKIVT